MLGKLSSHQYPARHTDRDCGFPTARYNNPYLRLLSPEPKGAFKHQVQPGNSHLPVGGICSASHVHVQRPTQRRMLTPCLTRSGLHQLHRFAVELLVFRMLFPPDFEFRCIKVPLLTPQRHCPIGFFAASSAALAPAQAFVLLPQQAQAALASVLRYPKVPLSRAVPGIPALIP